MRTLHTAYRVSDLPRSLDFYRALGYEWPPGHADGITAADSA